MSIKRRNRAIIIPESIIKEDIIPDVRQKRFIPKLRDMTKTFIKMITPKVPTEEFRGGIKCIPFTIIASMEYGKTETAKIITKLVIEKYGEENVNPIISTSLDSLMANMDSKDVQMLIVDDSGTRSEKELNEVIKKFIIIRHKYGDIRELNEKERAGIVIICFTSQSLFLLKKKLRTHFRATIMKSSYDNKYDKDTMINMVGKEGFKMLQQITKKVSVQHDKSGLDFSVIKINGYEHAGIVHFPYESNEAAKIPWKEIEEDEDIITTEINKLFIGDLDFGSFQSVWFDEMKQDFKEIQKKLKLYYKRKKLTENCFTSVDNLRTCFILWFYKSFVGNLKEKEDQLRKILKLGARSLRPYISRMNNVWKSGYSLKKRQASISEQWVLKDLNDLTTLFSAHRNCSLHRTTNQSSDLCIHAAGEMVLALNVKWYREIMEDDYPFEITPETANAAENKAKSAILYLESFGKGEVFFNITAKETITRGELTPVGGDNVVILQEIVEKISALIPKVSETKKVADQIESLLKKPPNKTKKPKKKPVEKTKVSVTKSNKNDSKKLRNKK